MTSSTQHLSESNPMSQIARFDDWRDVKFEMAYEPAPNDYLKWTLGPDYKPGRYDVPFAGVNGNSRDGRLYGTNSIPIVNDIYCEPFVNGCSKGYTPHKTPGLFAPKK